jgi:hypothetical protein
MLILADFARRAAARLEDVSMANSELRAEADENPLADDQMASVSVPALLPASGS